VLEHHAGGGAGGVLDSKDMQGDTARVLGLLDGLVMLKGVVVPAGLHCCW
jgi:hypothetical protein